MIKTLLSSEWISQLSNFSQLIVGFSGGLDSTVLLHALASHPSFHEKLVAVHINHGLSSNSELWQDHCKQFCFNLGVNFIAHSVTFDRLTNIEEGARTARYAFFSSMLKTQGCLILAHHLDDQAETVLLQLFRGAGVDGLAAMSELGPLGLGTVSRPLLSYSRAQLEQYAAVHELTWIEDESNQDIKYSRNYLRHRVMPVLTEQWPGVVGTIARAAGHCQQARMNLDDLALQDSQDLLLPESVNSSILTSSSRSLSGISRHLATSMDPADKQLNSEDNKGILPTFIECEQVLKSSLKIEPLKALSFERITNVLRFWLKKNQVLLPSTLTFQRLIHEVVFASSDAMPIVSWDGVQVRRYQQQLYLLKKEEDFLPSCISWSEFPKPLEYANKTLSLLAKKSNQGCMVPQGAAVQVKFRRGGEEFFLHGQTKQLKKLFQEWAVPPWLRSKIPLVYINDQLAVVVGYAVSDLFFRKNSSQTWELTKLAFG